MGLEPSSLSLSLGFEYWFTSAGGRRVVEIPNVCANNARGAGRRNHAV